MLGRPNQLPSRMIASGFTIDARRAGSTLAIATATANGAASHTHKEGERLPGVRRANSRDNWRAPSMPARAPAAASLPPSPSTWQSGASAGRGSSVDASWDASRRRRLLASCPSSGAVLPNWPETAPDMKYDFLLGWARMPVKRVGLASAPASNVRQRMG